MYAYEDENPDGSESVKKVAKMLELDTLYKFIEIHLNLTLAIQFLFSFAISSLVFYADDWKVFVMNHPGFLILSGSVFLMSLVAARFFFLQIREAPLNKLVLVLFSLSKIYILGFVMCICDYNFYLAGLLLLFIDFSIATILYHYLSEQAHRIIGFAANKIFQFGILTFIYTATETLILVAVTSLASAAYQFTIIKIAEKRKFGKKDYVISSIFLYSLWFIPFSPEEV